MTALNATKRDSVASAMMRARVVLPEPGGPQKIIEEMLVLLDGAPQRLPGADDVLLAHELVQRARAHALGERGALHGSSADRTDPSLRSLIGRTPARQRRERLALAGYLVRDRVRTSPPPPRRRPTSP